MSWSMAIAPKSSGSDVFAPETWSRISGALDGEKLLIRTTLAYPVYTHTH